MRECNKCQKNKPLLDFPIGEKSKLGRKRICKTCTNLQASIHLKKAYAHDPKKFILRSKTYRLRMLENFTDEQRRRERERCLKSQRKRRLLILQHYSGGKPKCACCGEREIKFLAIDHIKGGGNKHKKITNGNLMGWLKKNNYPKGFQILCHNCNMAKGLYGTCPHVI